MPAPPREPDPPADPAAALRDYLATRDARCPYCKYNLRGVPSSRCPECAANLDLELVRDGTEVSRRATYPGGDLESPGPDSPWWLLILIPIFLAALGVIIAFALGWVR